jgi:hypothetical protein
VFESQYPNQICKIKKIGEKHMIVDKKGNLFEDRRKNDGKTKPKKVKTERRKEDNKIARKTKRK